MTQERRMGKVYEKLSVTERARLVLEAYKDGRKVDVLLDWTTPDDQRLELSRLVRQMITLNTNLAWLLASWEARLRHLQTQWMLYVTLRQWGAMAFEAALYLTLHDAAANEQSEPAHERLRQYLQRAPLNLGFESEPWNDAGHMAQAIEGNLGGGIMALWRELRAAEIVADEVARGFRGDDPLDGELSSRFSELLEGLRTLAAAAHELGVAVALEEPHAGLAEHMGALVLHGCH